MNATAQYLKSLAVVALGLLCFSSGVVAGDEAYVHVLSNPDQYLIARGPALSVEAQRRALESSQQTNTLANTQVSSKASSDSAERSAAVIAGNYTVIPNTTPGLLGNYSYIRFPNFNSGITTTTTVRMIGDATGTDYGTASVDSPPYSSPQLNITELYESIGGVAFNPADTSITLYLQNNQELTGVQHVYYNTGSDFFENMSACSFPDGVSYLPMTAGVVNVHTTTLQSRFPSVVKVHNKDAVTTAIRLRIHDGPTGNLLGIMQFNAAPNSTYAFGSPQLQAAVSYIPTGADYHINVFFDGNPAIPPNAIITHTVTNVRVSSAVLNLTTICNIND